MELTKQKAEDLNKMLEFSLRCNGIIGVGHFAKNEGSGQVGYYNHLLSLASSLMRKYDQAWIKVINDGFYMLPNTKPFLEEGGFLSIYRKEQQEQRIKDLTEQQLDKSVFQLRYWWVILLINTAISFLIAWFTKG